MNWIDAVILGLVEGITEYLPISSTGHLILVSALLGLNEPDVKHSVDAFNIVIQGGAILAVLGLYWPRVLQMIRGILQEEHARGATVLVSVHRLAEVEGLCTHAAILVSGRTLRSGAVEDLLHTEDSRYRLRVNDPERARAAIAEALPDLGCDAQDGVLILKATEAQAADAAAACVGADVRVFELALQRHTLDDLYLREVDR